jgi:16S rRNA (uracil1498-N3)-methyltransferase
MPTERRLFLPDGAWSMEETSWHVDDADTLHHLRTVQRVKAGDTVIALDTRGQHAIRCRVEELDRKTLTLAPLAIHESPTSTLPQVTLYASLTKESAWDLTIQKAVELGVHAIQPMLTDYGVVHPKSPEAKRERWQRIAKEAALQSERLDIPTVHPLQTLETCLASLEQCQTSPPNSSAGASSFVPSPEHRRGGKTLVLVERSQHEGGVPHLLQHLQTLSHYQTLNLWVGPEGGWSADERMTFFKDDRFTPVHIGAQILRAETASLAGLTLVLHAQEGNL